MASVSSGSPWYVFKLVLKNGLYFSESREKRGAHCKSNWQAAVVNLFDKDLNTICLILKLLISDDTISRCIQDMSQDFESQVIANIKKADFSHPVGQVNWHHWKGSTLSIQQVFFFFFFVTESSFNNFYLANDSRKQQKPKTFLMSTVTLVLMICHGNHA
jgi:hypothetical protein